jgi:hypothetical protein
LTPFWSRKVFDATGEQDKSVIGFAPPSNHGGTEDMSETDWNTAMVIVAIVAVVAFLEFTRIIP